MTYEWAFHEYTATGITKGFRCRRCAVEVRFPRTSPKIRKLLEGWSLDAEKAVAYCPKCSNDSFPKPAQPPL